MLSLNKLEKVLSANGYIIRTFFIAQEYCVYIEIVSINTADVCIVSIPKDFKFRVEHASNTYKISYINIEDSNTIEDYAGNLNEGDIENKYDEIDIQIQSDVMDNDIEEQLQESYKRYISLQDLSVEDKTLVKDMFRQLKRLKYCVQNIPYKLVIIHNSYMCILNPNDNIHCFRIKHYSESTLRRVLVMVDLELFYKNIKTTCNNISAIRQGIFKVLDKNHITQSQYLEKLLQEKNNIALYSIGAKTNKVKYDNYTSKLTHLLQNTTDNERVILEQLYHNQRSNEPNNASYEGIHGDISDINRKAQLDTRLRRIRKVKQDIIQKLMDITDRHEHMYLMFDKILYDNIVMMDKLMKNFQEAHKLASI